MGYLRISLILGFFPALLGAETLLVHLQPSIDSPVIATIDSESEVWESASKVEDNDPWNQVEVEDQFSGFVRRENLLLDESVQAGAEVRMTPSSRGQVLTTVEEGDQVTVNLVGDWVEITIAKALPGYVRSPEALEFLQSSDDPSERNYGQDPLLAELTESRIAQLMIPMRRHSTRVSERNRSR